MSVQTSGGADVTSAAAFDALRSLAASVASEIACGPIVPAVTPQEIRRHLASRYDFTAALDGDEVLSDVQTMLRTWQVHVTHPRYFGLFNPSVTAASVVADALVAIYNPQLATWRTSPAANEIERHTLTWLMRKFGFPDTALASFTSGGAEANLSAVIVALTRQFPEYGRRGVRGLSAAPTIYVSTEAHHSFSKIAHMTGLGRDAIRMVATDGELEMDVEDLARLVAADRRDGCAPFMVVGTAGTTGAGAIDPLPELAGFCRAENLWFHVDAAWGGAAIISPTLRQQLASPLDRHARPVGLVDILVHVRQNGAQYRSSVDVPEPSFPQRSGYFVDPFRQIKLLSGSRLPIGQSANHLVSTHGLPLRIQPRKYLHRLGEAGLPNTNHRDSIILERLCQLAGGTQERYR